MTIIARVGNMHIEFHVGPITNVIAAASYLFNVTIDKPGRYMGGVVGVNALGGDFIIGPGFLTRNAVTILFGDVINNVGVESVVVSCVNSGADTKDIQGTVILFIQD